MTKILLIVTALFSDGYREDIIIVTDSYDECYLEGMQQVEKYEKAKGIETVEVLCQDIT